MRRSPRSLARGVLIAGTLASAASAQAAGFDAVTGKLSVDGAAFALSFDDGAGLEARHAAGYDAFTREELDAADVADRLTDDAAAALEGDGALAFGGDLNYLSLDLAGLDALLGRRVKMTLWQQPQGARAQPSVTWTAGDESNPTYLGTLTFQPTGRVTSDGWEEWSSGPVDFAWADVVAPASLTLMDETIPGAYGGLAENPDARVLLDAFSVQDLGPSQVPVASCTLPTEADDCGAIGLCHLGRCVDAAIRQGQALLNDELRADYVDRRVFEVATFEGGRAPQGRADEVAAALDALKGAADACAFWASFAEAYTLLVDGHASAPTMAYPAYQNGGVCVHHGVADLLPGAPELPLVFQPGSTAVGAALQPGDALVRIDGVPVDQWAAAAGRLIQHPGDPAGRTVVTAPQIFVAALDTGAVATFQRCAQDTPCSAEQVEEITVDLRTLVGDALIAGEPVVGYGDITTCDYRFVRPVPSSPSRENTDYYFAGHQDEGDVRFLVINGVPQGYGEEGEAWFDAIDEALTGNPAQLILDERTGNGGGVDAVDWLAALLATEGDWFAMDFLPGFESDDLAEPRAAVVSCSESDNGYGTGCGNGFRWPFGSTAGAKLGQAADTKVAVVIGMDVSGNDYLTKLLRQRSGETRVFGAGATWGAFGVIWPMAAHLGELSGGSLQVQDTLFLRTEDDANIDFPTSSGERPDELVLQTQSDARLGRDTALEAARAWLSQG